jgi:hypothetical protein
MYPIYGLGHAWRCLPSAKLSNINFSQWHAGLRRLIGRLYWRKGTYLESVVSVK